VALAAGAAVALLGGAMACARVRRGVRALRALGGAPRLAEASAPDAVVLDVDAPLSVAAGWWRPRVMLSRGLLEVLTPAQREAVLAHERAHARRRDALRALVAELASMGHLPCIRRRLRAALRLATERACDEEAARRTGDRLDVAEALLAVERASADSGELAASLPSFGGSDLAARVRRLVEPAPAPPPPTRRLLPATVAVVTAVILAEPLHHVTEHVLAALLGAP
jgi:beta-lactamase regulating signal transducer with metallopeptidase domain